MSFPRLECSNTAFSVVYESVGYPHVASVATRNIQNPHHQSRGWSNRFTHRSKYCISCQCVVFKLWTRSIAYTTTSQLLANFPDNTLISILVPRFPKSLPLGPAFNQVNYPPRRAFWKQALHAVPRALFVNPNGDIVHDLRPERM